PAWSMFGRGETNRFGASEQADWSFPSGPHCPDPDAKPSILDDSASLSDKPLRILGLESDEAVASACCWFTKKPGVGRASRGSGGSRTPRLEDSSWALCRMFGPSSPRRGDGRGGLRLRSRGP